MTEILKLRHGLEQAISALPYGESEALMVTLDTGKSYLNLRGNPDLPEFIEAVAQVTGQDLPLKPNSFSIGEHQIFWQGPDEWLIETGQNKAQPLLSALESSLAGMHACLTDISGGITRLTLSGSQSRRLLAKGTTLDLDPRSFKPTDCAQTGLSKANVLIAKTLAENEFILLVRRTFGEFLLLWLNRSGCESGIRFLSR